MVSRSGKTLSAYSGVKLKAVWCILASFLTVLVIWSWARTIVDFRKQVNLFLACQGFASNVSSHNILYLGSFSWFCFLQGLTDDLEIPPCMMLLICVMSCRFFISLDIWPFKASSILVILIFTICHVWLDKELVVLHIIWWLYLWQHLQLSWRFQFSSLIMSDLMKNWWFFQSFSVFTLELIFNSHGDFSFHHLPWLSWWRIVGSLWLHNWPLTIYNSCLTFFEPLMLSDKTK